jgi:hypothetical protein
MRTPCLLRLMVLAGLAILPVGSGPVLAWTPDTLVVIARHGTTLAPVDLHNQMERHEARFREGVLLPFGDPDSARHVKTPDGRGYLDKVIVEEVERAIVAIERHYPFADIIHQLGVVAHYVADANNPLNTSDSDPYERDYSTDYLRYVESAHDRFDVVFNGHGRMIEEPAELEELIQRSLERSRAFYPSIGDEYRRVGAVNGIELYDDRSTAFGVGSLAFNHAVSDITGVLRYIWLRAGGADRLGLFPFDENQVVLLEKGEKSP